MLKNYAKYLDVIQEKIDYFFFKQKDYIVCKEGCARCCKNAQFPYSEIEHKYLMSGFETLPAEVQNIIKQNIEKVLELKQKHTDTTKVFTYQCPFLIENKCSCYQYRGIVCRTFGLISQGADDKRPQMPFCIMEGLNYSNVYDPETKLLLTSIYEKSGLETPPMVFNVDYKTLMDKEFEKGFNFTFGKVKPLIDWFDKED